MSFSRIFSSQTSINDGIIVSVETDTSHGLNSFTIVGLPDKTVDEARDRVGAALHHLKLESPKHTNIKTTISLAPAEIKKEGSLFDVPIALGFLLSREHISFDTEKKLFIGELGLNGDVKPIRGALSVAISAKKAGFEEIYVPTNNAEEVALISGILVFPVQTLQELIEHISPYVFYKNGQDKIKTNNEMFGKKIKPAHKTNIKYLYNKNKTVDYSHIRGQEIAKRGLEIAASGGHNVLMIGPAGTGKTMLAKAFSSILPLLSEEEVLEVTNIHSIAGSLTGGYITVPPFRAPHHTSSYVSIIGGGTNPTPGEVTLAHRGVLFMDEFPEFDRRVVESMRQPLEDRNITIARAKGIVSFQANFILIAAMNPCPCGNFNLKGKICSCSPSDLARYKRKLSGPIMDRIDMILPVENIAYEKLSEKENGETSNIIRERVLSAREYAHKRFLDSNSICRLNSDIGVEEINKENISKSVRLLLNEGAKKLGLSPRSYHRIIKLSRTIADLSNEKNIKEEHILEALQYRQK